MCQTIFQFLTSHSISVIWTIFTGLFFIMAAREHKKSKETLTSLRNSAAGNLTVNITGIDFGKFAGELEKANQESHRIASIAYLLAGATALFSTVLSLME